MQRWLPYIVGYKELRVQAGELYQPQVSAVSLPAEELAKAVEDALEFCFVMAYAQGSAYWQKLPKNITCRYRWRMWLLSGKGAVSFGRCYFTGSKRFY
jgi:6-phosphogluconate dehydrogenase